MTVHCSTTMASYVGVATFGSPSFPSWKMKTLSTDLGSRSAEKKTKEGLVGRGGREREKKSNREKSIYWMERVCLVSATALGAAGQRKWNDITHSHIHTQPFIT